MFACGHYQRASPFVFVKMSSVRNASKSTTVGQLDTGWNAGWFALDPLHVQKLRPSPGDFLGSLCLLCSDHKVMLPSACLLVSV